VGFIAVFMKFPVYNTIGGGGGGGSHNMHEVYIVTTEVHNAGSHDFFFSFCYKWITIEVNSLWYLNRHYSYFILTACPVMN
jgi:hypothetical protein